MQMMLHHLNAWPWFFLIARGSVSGSGYHTRIDSQTHVNSHYLSMGKGETFFSKLLILYFCNDCKGRWMKATLLKK